MRKRNSVRENEIGGGSNEEEEKRRDKCIRGREGIRTVEEEEKEEDQIGMRKKRKEK